MTTNTKNKNAELIDRVKSVSLLSYVAIGKHLGVSSAAVFQWREGIADLTPEIIKRLEEIEDFFLKRPPLRARKPWERGKNKFQKK